MTERKIVQTAKRLIKLHEAIDRDACRYCRDAGVVESDSPPGEGWSLKGCPSCNGNGRQARERKFQEFALANAVSLAQAVLAP